jgi:hypothetical protein
MLLGKNPLFVAEGNTSGNRKEAHRLTSTI